MSGAIWIWGWKFGGVVKLAPFSRITAISVMTGAESEANTKMAELIPSEDLLVALNKRSLQAPHVLPGGR